MCSEHTAWWHVHSVPSMAPGGGQLAEPEPLAQQAGALVYWTHQGSLCMTLLRAKHRFVCEALDLCGGDINKLRIYV